MKLGGDIKSFSSENTFLKGTDDRPTLRACMREQAEEITGKLGRRLAAFTVQVAVRYGDFTTLARQISVEEATLMARHTPGHTRGCTTWTMQAADGGQMRNVVVIGSPNVNAGYQLITNRDYPEIADDFAKTFRLLKSLPCDIFLGAHGNYYGMEAKHARLQQQPKANPFVDPEGYRAYVENRHKAFQETTQKQRK